MVGVAILYSTFLGDTFQSLMSVLPTSIVLILFQFRNKPRKSANMMAEIARNELALTTSIVALVILIALGVKTSWFAETIFVVGTYVILFFLYKYTI